MLLDEEDVGLLPIFPVGRTPGSIHAGVRKLCSSIAPGDPIYIDVEPEAWALRNECFPNVRRMVDERGGEVLFGWAIWQHGGYFIEAEHHAVYRKPDGSLVDITPGSTKKMLFLPDAAAVYDFKTARVTDNHRMALKDDPRLERILALQSKRNELLNGVEKVGGPIVLEGETAFRYHAIRTEMQSLATEIVGGSFETRTALAARPSSL